MADPYIITGELSPFTSGTADSNGLWETTVEPLYEVVPDTENCLFCLEGDCSSYSDKYGCTNFKPELKDLLFEGKVSTPSGYVYERTSLRKHLPSDIDVPRLRELLIEFSNNYEQ